MTQLSKKKVKPTTKVGGKKVKLMNKKQRGMSNASKAQAKLNPNREGRKVVREEVRQGSVNDARSVHNEFAELSIGRQLSTTGLSLEEIAPVVNPYILSQYVGGVVMKCMSATDRPQDYYTAVQMVPYYITNLENMGNVGVETWPRAIVELGWALTPRQVGRYRYDPNWEACVNWNADVVANGIVVANSGWSAPNPISSGTVSASGYVSQGTNAVIPVSDSIVRAWQAQFAPILDLVRIDNYKDSNPGDASAFSFDSGLGRIATSTGAGTLTVAAIIGVTSGDTLFMSANSTSVSETPIHRPHLAAIRVCTPAERFGSYYSSTVAVQRLGRYTIPVSALPGLLGYQRVTPSIRGKCQLKPVPGNATVTALLRRLEQVGTRVTALPTNWLASFSLGDIQNLTLYIYRSFLKQYSGSSIGANTIILNGAFTAAEPIHILLASSSVQSMRIPEYVQKLVGSQSPYVDKDGTLIPLVTTLSPPASGGTYTGVGQYAASPTSVQIGWATLVSNLALTYKSFEPYMVAFENMQFAGEYGKTLLDVSFIRDNGNNNNMGVCSRRPLTSMLTSSASLVLPAISYDTAPGSATSSPNFPNLSTLNSNHSFRQSYIRYYSGYDPITNLSQMSYLDGWVSGALTSNMSDATGPDNSSVNGRPLTVPDSYNRYPLGPRLMKEVPNTSKGLVTRWAARLIPRSGKYCGPGWTAGQDTGDSDPYIGPDGKYIIPPSSVEDEICKQHDEAYHAAAGDPKAVAKADEHMLKRLSYERSKNGLSLYGHAAELAIATKLGLQNPHVDPF